MPRSATCYHRRVRNVGLKLARVVLCLGSFSINSPPSAASLSDPEVDAYNVRVGTQTFGPRYHFTTNTVLVETAEAILGMGSDILKFYLGPGFGGQYPGITLPASVTNLLTLARDEPSCRRVLDLPFRHCVIWSYCFAATGDAWWSDGFSASERQKEYDEVYNFSRHLLTNYNNSGKSFYLGHWEGDWHLLGGFDTSVNPTPVTIQGMIDWLNTRQQAVDDARRDVPHTNVAVFNYAEVNLVRDAMFNAPTNNQRLVNTVLPYVTNLDFVSWSSYDGMNLGTTDLYATLDYIEARLPTNKAAAIPGKRVIIGEYGWGGVNTSSEQEPLTRAYLQKLIPWGVRYILFWEMYDNDNKAYWLIDSTGAKTPCYFLHRRFANHAKLQVARFRETNGRLPTDPEFAALVTPILNQPLPEPPPLALFNHGLLAITGAVATVSATLEQGVYGDDAAAVWVFWGFQDGGTAKASWANACQVGVNTRFNPAAFTAQLTNLVSGTNAFFRFYATNRTGEVWASNSVPFSVEALADAAFGSRMKISFAGYTRGEPLRNFPALVTFNTNTPGFDYQQFASPTGGDLRFANATGTAFIPHEIDEWNTNGVSSVWVQVPWLSGTNDSIGAFWGNPAATNPPATSTNGAVWSEDYELVWHLRESGLPHADSTLKHPAASGNNPAWTKEGAVGHAGVFNGTSSYLNAGTINLGDHFTLSAWMKVDSTANSIQTLWGNKSGGFAMDGVALFVNSWETRDQLLLLETGNGTSGAIAVTPTNVASFNEWHHVAATVDRSAGVARLFLDGIDRTSLSPALTDFANQRSVTFGAFADHLFCFKGLLDEARIETETRSMNWVWASWMTVASHEAFTTYEPVSRQRPSLTLSIQDGTAQVNWPGSGVGFQLYAATNLAPPVNWIRVTNQALLTMGQWQAILPASNDRVRFYRLHSL